MYVTGVMDKGGRTVKISCPYCGRKHTHGAPGGEISGPRNSHCLDHTLKGSYTLVPPGWSPDSDAG